MLMRGSIVSSSSANECSYCTALDRAAQCERPGTRRGQLPEAPSPPSLPPSRRQGRAASGARCMLDSRRDSMKGEGGMTATVGRGEAAGVSARNLHYLDRHLQRYIDGGKLAGAIAVVFRKGELAHFSPLGMADRERQMPMREDT